MRPPLYPFCLAALLCMPAFADTVTIDVPREIQQADELCWAAVSTMAVNSFGITIKEKVGDPAVPLSQRAIVALRDANSPTAAQLAQNRAAFDQAFEACASMSNCASSGEPWLYRLKQSDVPAGKMLALGAFGRDIGERHTPIIIQWKYPAEAHPQADNPDARHVLIVTGYDPDGHPPEKTAANGDLLVLRVWDPWPTLERAGQQAQPPQREKWITYQQYIDPGNDDGVTAQHEGDIYKLRRTGTAAPKRYPPLADVPAQNISQPIEVEFARGIESIHGTVDATLQAINSRQGMRQRPALVAAPPFPVVGLSQRALLQARTRPDALLVNRTQAYVVPVLSRGQVVDSFIVTNTNGVWLERGYSNNRIAQLLVDLRERFKGQGRPEASFYLAAIPSRGAFFIGHGFGAQSELASLANDGRGDLSHGNEVLKSVIERMDRGFTGGTNTRHRPPAGTPQN
jgi:hypothetical protein